jgi:predicted Zn-dependent protease with MMP-like domain
MFREQYARACNKFVEGKSLGSISDRGDITSIVNIGLTISAETSTSMTEKSIGDSFEKIVEWAYNTLPEKIRNLPNFPGIQVSEEPPVDVLKDIQERRNWPKEKELLGLYSGLHRDQPRHFQSRISPDLIFVFRGPILRCSKGNLPAEVKQVVWHEVAHWLGHDESEVKELGLSISFTDLVRDPLDVEPKAVSQEGLAETDEYEDIATQKARCLKCYSTDVICRELDKPLTPHGAWLTDPVLFHETIWKCESCGYEWDDDDNG